MEFCFFAKPGGNKWGLQDLVWVGRQTPAAFHGAFFTHGNHGRPLSSELHGGVLFMPQYVAP
jgi:hypothetical protein